MCADYLDQLVGSHHRAAHRPPAHPRRERPATRCRPRRRSCCAARQDPRLRVGQHGHLDHPCDRGLRRATDHHRRLRARLPDLRAREINLRNQIHALNAQLAEQQRPASVRCQPAARSCSVRSRPLNSSGARRHPPRSGARGSGWLSLLCPEGRPRRSPPGRRACRGRARASTCPPGGSCRRCSVCAGR